MNKLGIHQKLAGNYCERDTKLSTVYIPNYTAVIIAPQITGRQPVFAAWILSTAVDKTVGCLKARDRVWLRIEARNNN